MITSFLQCCRFYAQTLHVNIVHETIKSRFSSFSHFCTLRDKMGHFCEIIFCHCFTNYLLGNITGKRVCTCWAPEEIDSKSCGASFPRAVLFCASCGATVCRRLAEELRSPLVDPASRSSVAARILQCAHFAHAIFIIRSRFRTRDARDR